jgi:hypothetical protein
MLRKLAWVYTGGFLAVVIITHTPAFNDENGLSFGLFKIDPVDDFVHLLSGIAGFIVAAFATRCIPLYFKAIGILYGLDVVVGMLMSRGFLDLSVFTRGPAAPDFGLTNWLLNLPHIVIAGLALVVGFRPGTVDTVSRPEVVPPRRAKDARRGPRVAR